VPSGTEIQQPEVRARGLKTEGAAVEIVGTGSAELAISSWLGLCAGSR
jgi:hypothetical protein